MRIFFFKAISLLIGLVFLTSLLGPLGDRVALPDDWSMEYQQRMTRLYAKNETIEAITLGNSHSDSLDYSVMGIEGQSLAFPAADLFEVEKIAEVLVDELPNLKTVFITLSYYSFSRDNAQFESLKTRRIEFYSLLPVRSPITGDTQNFLLGKANAYTHIMSVARSDHWKGVWQRSFYGSSLEQFPYDGVQTSSKWGECAHYTADQLDMHALEITGRNVSSSLEMAVAHPGLEQDAFEALARTIERLQSRGVRVVLFTPTYHEKFNYYFGQDGSTLIASMKRSVVQLQQRYGVEYYDLSHDPDVTIHIELFYNSDHLSECGQKVFSEKLLEKMGETSKIDRGVLPPLSINH
jgi:hypothetical protein